MSNCTFTTANNLEYAIHLACLWHKDQKDKAGEPYILHPLRVMLAGETDTERIVFVLHDSLEDALNREERAGRMALILKRFGWDVYDAINAMTIRRGEDYLTAYIPRVKANPLAKKGKLADTKDNLNMERIPAPTPHDVARWLKYLEARRILQEAD